MSVVPERIHEFYEPPKPQEGTALPRYGVESGYLVLEDLKTRDLPRPPPAGRESARKLGTVACAAVFVFVSVLAVGIVVHLLMSMDRDSKISDPPWPTNHTNETVTFANLQVDAKEEESAVQVAGEDEGGLAATSALASWRRRSRKAASRRGRPKSTPAQGTPRRRGLKEAAMSWSSKQARRPNTSAGTRLLIFPRRKNGIIARRRRSRLPTLSKQPGRFLVSRRRRHGKETTTTWPPRSAPAARLPGSNAEATTTTNRPPPVLTFTTAAAARTESTLHDATASPPSGKAFVDFFGLGTQLDGAQMDGDSSVLTSIGPIGIQSL